MIKTTANIVEVGSKLAASYITKQMPGFQGKHSSIIRNHTNRSSWPSIYEARKFILKGINITHSESNGIK